MKSVFLGVLSFIICLSVVPVSSGEKEPIVNYQALFSPHDRLADELIVLIEKERVSIKAAIYCLMHRGIAKALINAKNRGVQVEVIVDPYSIKVRSPLKKMREAHVPIFVWSPKVDTKGKKHRSLMHDKFCIFGDRIVWTGSFNFTLDATTSNQENVIVLESRELALKYLEQFERLKKLGCLSISEYIASLE